MSRVQLPEGVAPSNEKKTFDAAPAEGKADFVAPDMATPAYAREDKESRFNRTVHEKHEVYERVVEEDDDEEDEEEIGRGPREETYPLNATHGPSVLHILIAISFLLLVLAGIVVAKNRQTTPYCSDLPEWNQYNCLPG